MHISSTTLIYLAIVFGVLVVPRALQRFRLPAPLTCFALGVVVTSFFHSLARDRVFNVVATLGIASLFLFAGLEVDLVEIRRQLGRLSGHLGIRGGFLVLTAWLAMRYMHMSWQPAALLALGLFTPSTGFILDTLPESGLDAGEQTEVTISSVAGEITALLVLFVVSQADSISTFAVSSVALLLLIVFTPLFFLALGRYVVPYARGSEFSLLLMVGIICAVISQGLGVHVWWGPSWLDLSPDFLRNAWRQWLLMRTFMRCGLFASFFVPFYFFDEGLKIPAGALVLKALLCGLALSAIVIPIRVAKSWVECRYFCGRTSQSGIRVSVALVPTLIFTLVIAGILYKTFHIDDVLYGGLLVYAAISTILPSFVLPRFAQLPSGEVVAEA